MARAITRLTSRLPLTTLKRSLTTHPSTKSPTPTKPTSALFISGRHGSEVFAYFSPYLDFDARFNDMSKTQEDLKKRRLEINLSDLRNAWDMLKTLQAKKNSLDANRNTLRERLQELSKVEDPTKEPSQEYKSLKLQLELTKRDYKTISEAVWDMEEDVVLRCLRLPTPLHEKTPVTDLEALETFGCRSSSSPSSCHLETGSRLGVLEYSDRFSYFLIDQGALFELAVLNLAADSLSSDSFLRVSGLDFTRSSIVEAGGADPGDPMTAFELISVNDSKDILNPLHLVGSASLASFLAFHTRVRLNPKLLPLRYYATGRRYTPRAEDDGLFGVCQESVVQVFGLAKNPGECDELLQTFLDSAKRLYSNLCGHFRVVLRPAYQLEASENLRVSFEMWSVHRQKYVEVGHLAVHGDYFGKRVLAMYQTPVGKDFVHAISGTLVSVPKLLGCLLEESGDEFSVPEGVKSYMTR